jgi:hypothetical protein
MRALNFWKWLKWYEGHEEQKVPNVDIYLIWKVDKTDDSSIVNGVWYMLEFDFISWCNQNDCLFLGFVIEWEL